MSAWRSCILYGNLLQCSFVIFCSDTDGPSICESSFAAFRLVVCRVVILKIRIKFDRL